MKLSIENKILLDWNPYSLMNLKSHSQQKWTLVANLVNQFSHFLLKGAITCFLFSLSLCPRIMLARYCEVSHVIGHMLHKLMLSSAEGASRQWNSEGGRRSSILCLILCRAKNHLIPLHSTMHRCRMSFFSYIWRDTYMEKSLEDVGEVSLKIALWTKISWLEITLVLLPPWVSYNMMLLCPICFVYIGPICFECLENTQ